MRFEAWTLPWSAEFKRVIADIPAVAGSGLVRFNDFGDGQVSVPASYTRLSEIISTTTATLIRAYDDTTIVQEFLAERVEHRVENDTDIAVISGGDLATVFDRVVVYPFDYPTNDFPDHVWGGDNLLQNPGFEQSQARPDIQEVWTDATSGQIRATLGSDTVDFDFDATPLSIELAIEAGLTDIDDINVSGTGTEDDPYVFEYVTPPFGQLITFSDLSLSGGDLHVTRTQFGALEPTGWEKSQERSTGVPVIHGDYDSFRVTTAQAHSGTYSLLIDPATIGRRYAGAQQVVNVTPGGIYQASVWVRTGSVSQEYRFVIRGYDGDLLAETQATLSANTWTEFTLSDVNVGDNSQIIFRIANINVSGNPAIFYVDDAEFYPGAEPATIGTIVQSLMDDAAVDHASDTRGTILDWVDYTGFDATNDSSTTAWAASYSFTAYRGMSYGQVWDKLVDLGAEWVLTPKAAPSAGKTHDLNWYDTGNAGTDHTAAATPAINVGQGVTGGPVVQRIPQYTAVLVEGEGLRFVEDKDATAETNFGRFETYTGDKGLASTASLTALGDELLAKEAANRIAVAVEVTSTPDHPHPLVAYRPGDTIYFQLPPYLAKTSRRIRQIAWKHGQPDTYTVTGSRVFDKESGAWEAVRLLLRRFQPLPEKPANRAGATGGGGGEITVSIAAANATELSKAKADYLCDGIDDHVELIAADGICSTVGGRIKVSEGTFKLDPDLVVLSANVILEGSGEGTILEFDSAPAVFGITVGAGGKIEKVQTDKKENMDN